MNDDINKLKDLIQKNPPEDAFYWTQERWEQEFDGEISNWRSLLRDPNYWENIKEVIPKKSYENLLLLLLPYAPSCILKDYLEKANLESYYAFKTLLDNNMKRLNPELWQLLKADTKLEIISKISNEIKDLCLRDFLREYPVRKYMDNLSPLSSMFPNLILDLVSYEEIDFLHPMWIKLKDTITQSNDLNSMKIVDGFEKKFEDRMQRITERIKQLLHFAGDKYFPYSHISENIMF
ncbi:MAG: hypothetical protein PHI95_06650, partial [Bacteroidales bacterium]|nr:hypothetical protein [Bacteroidales bacterium]